MDLTKLKKILASEPKLIEIKNAERVIFAGDTHGDLEASRIIMKNWLKPGNEPPPRARGGVSRSENGTGQVPSAAFISAPRGGVFQPPKNKIVFLGDYVDRGPHSRENLDYLLEKKETYPDQIFLLQGNHEGRGILKFSPSDFWEGLKEKERVFYSSIVEKFPFAAVADGVIALHGALPDIENLKEINNIETGDEKWIQIMWGDLSEREGKYLGVNPLYGRPHFGKSYFFDIMKKINKRVLIRSHQPNVPKYIFQNRCLTIFTSSVYKHARTVAILNPKKSIKDARDLEIKII